MRKKSVLLLGSYGQTNLGDDLLMWNFLKLLRQKDFEKIYVNASVADNIPEVVQQEFPDLVVFETYKTSMLAWAKIIRRVDCVVYGGGTIFKELYATTGRGRYSVIVRILLFNIMAKMLGAKIYYLNIGIGVLKTAFGRAITRGALGGASLSIFRDQESYEFARHTLGLPENRISLATDGLFINDTWQTVWNSIDLHLPKSTRVVGINLLADIPDWVDGEVYVREMRRFISSLLDDGAFVLLVPFQHDFNPNNDRVFMQREIMAHFSERENIRLLDSLPIDQAVSVFQQLDVFVGMRFHSLLLAASSGTPFVGVAYDTKCWRFIQENNYPYATRLEDLTELRLTIAFKELIDNLAAARATLRTITASERKKGQQCAENLTF